MLTLHYHPATVAAAIAIVMEELSLDYLPVFVDFAQGAQQSPAHLALNPKGRVPVLITDAGTLTETGAILDWLAAMFGPHLIPDDVFDAARMRETMYYLASTMHVNHAHRMRGARWADLPASHADMTAKVPQTMTASCAYLESHLDLAPFAVTGALTLADAYLYVVVRWASGDGVDMTAFPKLSAHQVMMADRFAVRAVVNKGLMA